MAHSQDVRDKVRRAYVFNSLSLEISAMQAGVSFPTARRWKREASDAGDDWDKIRTASVMAGGGLEEVARTVLIGLVAQYQSTIEAITFAEMKPQEKVEMLASLADAYNKSISASRKILPETSQLATALEVLQKLGSFISERHPQHLAAFAEILEPFGEEVQRSYG